MISEKRESQIAILTCVDGKSRVQTQSSSRGNSRPPPGFDQQAFAEVVGVAVATIAQASAVEVQGGPSDLLRFMAHRPPSFRGGGDPMVTYHLFRQVERVLEAIGITSNSMRIRLATFKLEGESLIWWDWAKVSRDQETMTLEEL